MKYKKELKNLPKETGIYLARGILGLESEEEIDVYYHPTKGLSCYQEDFGSSGSGVNPETDCHVSVQATGLKFIKKIRELDKN